MKIKIRSIDNTSDQGLDFCTANTSAEIDETVALTKRMGGFNNIKNGTVELYNSHQLCFDDKEVWCEIIVSEEG